MRRDLTWVALVVALPATADTPRFAPIPNLPHHVYDGGWEHFVGGGVAVFDCDGDLRPEIFAAGGENRSVLLRNRSDGADLRFEAQTPEPLRLTGVTGAYPFDIDGDGWSDLAVLRVGQDQLLRGGPDCSFAPFDIGFDSEDHWTTAFSATWEPGNALPTLAFGSYVDRHDPDGPFEVCAPNWIYRPDGDRYSAPIALDPGFCTLSMLFTDWGRRGQQDLRISNDRHYYVKGGSEQLWSLSPALRLYNEDDGWRPFELWGMGIASRDISGDGRPEVFLTSMGDQRLQEPVPGENGPTYRDVPYAKGTTAHRPHIGEDGRPSTGWHVQFGDVSNDGRDDVFIAKGNVDQMPGLAMDDPNSLLIQRPDGTFVEASVTAGVASPVRSRGAALVDLDLDGRLDLVVANRRAPLEVYRNVTTDIGNWLAITLDQPGPNPRAVGAWIELQVEKNLVSREITVGGGHVSGQWGAEHFGLGPFETVDVRVIWPDGHAGAWQTLRTDQALILSRDR